MEQLDFLFSYYKKKVYPKRRWIWKHKINFPPISESLKREIPLLIEGYEKYLSLVSEGKMSKKYICDKIEDEFGKSVVKAVNVRQEFHRYDSHFERLENYVNNKLENDIKILLLRSSFRGARDPITF